jgi:hypothetical protein
LKTRPKVDSICVISAGAGEASKATTTTSLPRPHEACTIRLRDRSVEDAAQVDSICVISVGAGEASKATMTIISPATS